MPDQHPECPRSELPADHASLLFPTLSARQAPPTKGAAYKPCIDPVSRSHSDQLATALLNPGQTDDDATTFTLCSTQAPAHSSTTTIEDLIYGFKWADCLCVCVRSGLGYNFDQTGT